MAQHSAPYAPPFPEAATICGMRTHVPALVLLLIAAPAAAQIKGPVAPGLTPEQIAHSEALAAKFDESAAKEKRRLETFANRPARRQHSAVVQRLHQLSRDGGGDDPRVQLCVPADSRGADVRRADQSRGRRALFVLPPGRAAARRSKAGAAEPERHDVETRHHRRAQGIDRVLRSRARGSVRAMADGNCPVTRRLVERAGCRPHARTRSFTAWCTRPKTTGRSRPTSGCRGSCRHRRRCILPRPRAALDQNRELTTAYPLVPAAAPRRSSLHRSAASPGSQSHRRQSARPPQ